MTVFRVRFILGGESVAPSDYGRVAICAAAVDRIVNAIYEADAHEAEAAP